MELESPWIESFMVGDLQMRCSVVTDLATGDTIIIDGGGESDRIISWIEKFEGLGPEFQRLTGDSYDTIKVMLEGTEWEEEKDDFFLQMYREGDKILWLCEAHGEGKDRYHGVEG